MQMVSATGSLGGLGTSEFPAAAWGAADAAPAATRPASAALTCVVPAPAAVLFSVLVSTEAVHRCFCLGGSVARWLTMPPKPSPELGEMEWRAFMMMPVKPQDTGRYSRVQ